MFQAVALLALALAGVQAQQVGTLTAENHPPLTWTQYSSSGSPTTVSGSVVLDANWRWLHQVGSSTNCYTGNTWDTAIASSPSAAAANCALDGADYSGTYGVTTSGNSLKIDFVTKGANTNVGSRLYLLDSATEYHLFKPLNREFTFDVDVSNLPCGLNGALYFSQMDADGGLSKYPTNKAGAKYGTGYCDSQCPRDLKFINGLGNTDWTPDSNSANSGTGANGSCCNEMDIWEANSISTAYTPHPCAGAPGQTVCTGDECGATSDNRYAGFCDPDGCDFNSYRLGNTSFYGPGKTVDTTKVFTVVTQFITDDGTDTGTLSEIKRFYVQNGVVIPNSNANIAGVPAQNYIDENFCDAQKAAFGDNTEFEKQGGLATIGSGFETGTVLVLSLWDDYAAQMLWLDSDYPVASDPTSPGVSRGTCATTSGAPPDVESNNANAYVVFSNIKFGPIGSTFAQPPPSSSSTGTHTGTTTSSSHQTTTTTSHTSSSSTHATTTTTSAGPQQTKYGQCGGTGYTGPTVCASGSTCTAVSPPWYYQCL